MIMLNGNDHGLTEAHYIAERNAERCESQYPMNFSSSDSMEGIAAHERVVPPSDCGETPDRRPARGRPISDGRRPQRASNLGNHWR
jgi:hypothetical protein